LDKGGELVTAIGVASELVEAGEAGAEQGVVTRAGDGREGLHGLGEIPAKRMGETGLDASRCEDFACLADQGGVADAGSYAVDKTGGISALGFTSGDQQDRALETGEGGFGGVEVGRL
jgi:hypothetical protein